MPIYLWIFPANSLFLHFHRIDYADDGGIDGGIRAANSGHGGETFRAKQNAVADSRVDGIEREDWIAAIRAVQLKRLDYEDLAPFVGRNFLCGNHIADDAANQHALQCSVQSRR